MFAAASDMRWRVSALAVSGLCGLAIACGPKVQIDPNPFDLDDPRAAPDPVDDAAPDRDTDIDAEADGGTESAIAGDAGHIERGDLDEVLANGPGPYMRGIDVEAVTGPRGERDFRGWRIVRWDHGWADLRAGDVVTAVNDIAIVRPNDVDTLWSALAAADELVIEFERDGTQMALRWAIQ